MRGLHGAAQVARYMPQGMQEIGARCTMRGASSRFEAQNAGISNDGNGAVDIGAGGMVTLTHQPFGRRPASCLGVGSGALDERLLRFVS
jgi:hypothetical protein